jgi:hypothetical protein
VPSFNSLSHRDGALIRSLSGPLLMSSASGGADAGALMGFHMDLRHPAGERRRHAALCQLRARKLELPDRPVRGGGGEIDLDFAGGLQPLQADLGVEVLARASQFGVGDLEAGGILAAIESDQCPALSRNCCRG